jgi:hypothetical protein
MVSSSSGGGDRRPPTGGGATPPRRPSRGLDGLSVAAKTSCETGPMPVQVIATRFGSESEPATMFAGFVGLIASPHLPLLFRSPVSVELAAVLSD